MRRVINKALKFFNKPSISRTKPTRLHVEQLGERILPAICVWDGYSNHDWNNPNNWVGNDVPINSDSVVLDTMPSTGNRQRPIITGDVSIINLSVTSGYQGNLEIQSGGNLTVYSGVWGFDKNITGDGSFGVAGGVFSWSNGTIDVTNVNVSLGGSIEARENAIYMNPQNLNIGYTKTGTTSAGKFIISPDLGPLSQNLVLKTTEVYVSPGGIVDFDNATGSNTRGGIAPVTGTNYIHNGGLVRVADGDLLDETIHIGIPVKNYTTSSKLVIGAGDSSAKVQFDDPIDSVPSVWQTGAGTVAINSGSVLTVSNDIVIDDGYFLITDNMPPSTQIHGDLLIQNGADDITIGTVESLPKTLFVDGDVTMTSGVYRAMADGSSDGVCDTMDIDGDFTMGGTATLSVITKYAQPLAGYHYDIIKGDMFGADFTGFAWLEMEAKGYKHEMRPSEYRLSKSGARIAGREWRDNGVTDGLQTTGEGTGSYSWMFTLYDASNTYVASVSGNGSLTSAYSFDIWQAGYYTVKFELWGFFAMGAAKDVGSNDTIDNDFGSWSGISLLTGYTSSMYVELGDVTTYAHVDAGWR